MTDRRARSSTPAAAAIPPARAGPSDGQAPRQSTPMATADVAGSPPGTCVMFEQAAPADSPSDRSSSLVSGLRRGGGRRARRRQPRRSQEARCRATDQASASGGSANRVRAATCSASEVAAIPSPSRGRSCPANLRQGRWRAAPDRPAALGRPPDQPMGRHQGCPGARGSGPPMARRYEPIENRAGALRQTGHSPPRFGAARGVNPHSAAGRSRPALL